MPDPTPPPVPAGPSDPRATATPQSADVIAMFGQGATWEPGGGVTWPATVANESCD